MNGRNPHPERFMRQLQRNAWYALAALLITSSCKDSTSPTNDIRDFITDVATLSGSSSASFHAGAVPTDGSGPIITVSGTSAMILGGSALRTVTSASAFTRVIVAVDGQDGYWDLTVPSTTSADVVLTLAQTLPNNNFTVQYAAGSNAALGAEQSEAVSIVTVGTGDIQISVSWNAESDVDLHLVEPGDGEEIYYGNTNSTAGGELDLDSNAACSIDHVKNENITYPSVTPPHGTYTVRVDYYDSCEVVETKYVVTIQVKGHSPQTFTGTFTGDGDFGGEGDGVTITTFTF
jgi:hypothetical protein